MGEFWSADCSCYSQPCYRNARMQTVAIFAQTVYLLFSSVYVCKETVEHVLLTTGGDDGHHHHHGDENALTGFVLSGATTFGF
jgi:hypothetical protein